MMGDHGSGKSYCTGEAIKNMGRVPYRVNLYNLAMDHFEIPVPGMAPEYPMRMVDPGLEYLRKFVKTIPGNGVLVVDEAQYLQPAWACFILEQMLHPERPIVLISKDPLQSLVIMDRCRIIKMIGAGTFRELKV